MIKNRVSGAAFQFPAPPTPSAPQTESGGVNHTPPAALTRMGGDDRGRRHLSVQPARRHGQAERRLPAQRPGNQQTFVLHLLQTHHHLLGGRRGQTARGESQGITRKRLPLWVFFSVITKQSRHIFPTSQKNAA